MPVIQLKNSNVPNKRPAPSSLASGELAVNTAVADPGLFFQTTAGTLAKVGPVSVSNTAPNSTPAGFAGNCIGELWADSSVSSAYYPLKVFTAQGWKPVSTTTNLTGLTTNTYTGLGLSTAPGTSSGVYVGYSAGSAMGSVSEQVAIGHEAKGCAGSGYGVLIGYRAGANQTGTNQTQVFIGSNAGENSVNADDSVGVGFQALRNIKAKGRVAFGYQAMRDTTTGGGTAVGYASLQQLTTGTANCGVGTNTLSQILTGSNNTAIGESAGFNLTGAASNNILIGNQAGGTGALNGNVCIGNNAGKDCTGSNNIFIGNNCASNGGSSNYAVIIGPYTGSTTGLSNHVIICNGNGVPQLHFNENGAMLWGANSPGPAGAPLLSQGAYTSPDWAYGGWSGTLLFQSKTVTVKAGLVVAVA